jgi:hypothetical protein
LSNMVLGRRIKNMDKDTRKELLDMLPNKCKLDLAQNLDAIREMRFTQDDETVENMATTLYLRSLIVDAFRTIELAKALLDRFTEAV